MSAKQTSDRSIKAAIQQMAGTFGQDVVKLNVGKVKSVDEDKSTCVVVIKGINQSVEVPNVNLQVGVCDGLQIIPAVDSDVLIITSTFNQSYIIQYSDVDKYYLQVGDSELTINNDGTMQLNDGSYDGLVKVAELTQKLNDIENLLNEFIGIYNAHTHTIVPIGIDTDPPSVPETNTLTPTQQEEIENNLITHGTI